MEAIYSRRQKDSEGSFLMGILLICLGGGWAMRFVRSVIGRRVGLAGRKVAARTGISRGQRGKVKRLQRKGMVWDMGEVCSAKKERDAQRGKSDGLREWDIQGVWGHGGNQMNCARRISRGQRG